LLCIDRRKHGRGGHEGIRPKKNPAGSASNLPNLPLFCATIQIGAIRLNVVGKLAASELHARAAAEVEMLPVGSAPTEMPSDYAMMRDQARAYRARG
jgi:hypothetical protein